MVRLCLNLSIQLKLPSSQISITATSFSLALKSITLSCSYLLRTLLQWPFFLVCHCHCVIPLFSSLCWLSLLYHVDPYLPVFTLEGLGSLSICHFHSLLTSNCSSNQLRCQFSQPICNTPQRVLLCILFAAFYFQGSYKQTRSYWQFSLKLFLPVMSTIEGHSSLCCLSCLYSSVLSFHTLWSIKSIDPDTHQALVALW